MNQSRPELMEEVKLHDSPKERAQFVLIFYQDLFFETTNFGDYTANAF